MLELFENQQPGSFAEHESVAIAIEGAAGAGRVVVHLREGLIWQKPLMPIGVTAASVPPVTITSASPYWMALKDSPMALVVLAQAVATAALGPREAELDRNLAAGRVDHQLRDGERRDFVGPFFQSRRVLRFDFFRPPIPVPRITPQRNGSSQRKSRPESRTASMPATMANCEKRSSRFASLAEM